jgi:hypothetical protein
MAEAELIVTRTSPKDIGIRDLYVQLDDHPEYTLKNTQALKVPLPAGKHRLRITNRLFAKVEEFELQEGEKATFEVANVRAGLLFAPLMVIGGTGAYKVAIERLP